MTPSYSKCKRICFYSKANASPLTQNANEYASTQKLTDPPPTQNANESASTQKLTEPLLLKMQTNLLLLKS